MLQQMKIPDKLYYVIERGDFEYRRALSSIAFMLDKHVNDQTWLESAEFNDLVEKAIEKRICAYIYDIGTLGALLGVDGIPERYQYNRERTGVTYVEETR